MLVLVSGLIGYALIVSEIALRVLPENRLVEAAFYLAAGLVWIPAAVILLRWTERR